MTKLQFPSLTKGQQLAEIYTALGGVMNKRSFEALSEDQQFAEIWEEIGAPGAEVGLPTQTGNGGKVLRTNGTDASWSFDGSTLTELDATELIGDVAIANLADALLDAGPIGAASLTTTGNVEIGTTTGIRRLNVESSGETFAAITTTSDGNVGVFFGVNGNDTKGRIVYGNVTGDIPEGFQFVANNLVRMTINSTGNVGIGTTTPAAALQIVKTVTSGTIWGELIDLTATGATNATGLYIAASGATNNRALYIEEYAPPAGANNYAIYSACQAKSYFAGSVGIGPGGTPLQSVLSVAASVDFASMAAGAEDTQPVTVTGVTTTNTPSVSLGFSAALEAGIVIKQVRVSGDDTISITALNVTAGTIDPAAVTVRATVLTF